MMESHVLFALVAALAFATLGHVSADDAYVTDDIYIPPPDIYEPPVYNTDDTYPPTEYHDTYLPPEYGYGPPIYDSGDTYPPTEYSDDYVPSYAVYPPATDYESTGVPYTPPPPEYEIPEVIYPAGYGTHYGVGDPFALLWQSVWARYHVMEYQVKIVEDYRYDIMAAVTKLSQKVFGWCRSKENAVLSYEARK